MGWFRRKGILHLCGSKQTGQPVRHVSFLEDWPGRRSRGGRARGRGTKASEVKIKDMF